jgi:hypothetical protein
MNQQQDKNWWGRNWKWFIPVVCLGSLVIFAGFIAGIMFLVFGMIKSSDVYKDAVARAQAYPSVREALGTPIEEGMFTTGNINVSGPSGQANLAIPISGPDGEGTIYAVATKSAGQWTFSTLIVEIKDTKQRINLLEEKPALNQYIHFVGCSARRVMQIVRANEEYDLNMGQLKT